MNSKSYWEKIYSTQKPTEVSWYQNDPVISREMIGSARIDFNQKIIDVGGGASILAETLLKKGFQDITVLDISLKGIQYAQERLHENAQRIKWVVGDIMDFEPKEHYDLWHDRGLFHFFRDRQDKEM